MSTVTLQPHGDAFREASIGSRDAAPRRLASERTCEVDLVVPATGCQERLSPPYRRGSSGGGGRSGGEGEIDRKPQRHDDGVSSQTPSLRGRSSRGGLGEPLRDRRVRG